MFSGKINCDGHQAILDEPEVEVVLDDAKKKMFRSAIEEVLQGEDISYDDLEAIFASKEFRPECDQKLFQDVVAGGGFHRLGGDVFLESILITLQVTPGPALIGGRCYDKPGMKDCGTDCIPREEPCNGTCRHDQCQAKNKKCQELLDINRLDWL